MLIRSELTFNKLDSIETSANVCDLFEKQRIRKINLRAYEMFQIDIYLLYTQTNHHPISAIVLNINIF